ncbi:DUF58 domain-containing protein [Pseudoalteromonas shioyasakiensis]|uniref:DUF58 domain-containing protein n=1 Tax=Pseudoalteromonas shioyasakiensis TaxID=1190813 RepID=UPI00211836BD|nr:DUF58 domain-containing protein [Pseudoalteromonas shioyasakiensis]MCQ8878620.1 DUF58 domain-containing protein [Pseudoalteromonas shioyasakiensis]
MAISNPAVDKRIYSEFKQLKGLQSRARKLSFLPKQHSNSVLAGRHSSRIRGRGLSFEELRDYRVGDDIRSIDWRVTARTGKPHVRIYAEEKDRSALIIVDQRINMFFGSKLNMKSVTAAEAAAICAYRILEQGDRVGGVVFNDSTINSFKPSKKPQSLEQFIHTLSQFNLALNCELAAPAMQLNQPLQAATRLISHDQMIIIISDFDQVDEATEQYLSQMAAHNDVILCLVTDSINQDLPEDLNLNVSDGQQQITLDTSNKKLHNKLQTTFTARTNKVKSWQQQLGITVIELDASQDTLNQFSSAFAVG